MCDNANIERSILTGNVKTTEDLTRQWLASGRSAREFCNSLLFPVAETIRHRFAQGIFYLPELLVATRAARASMQIVRNVASDEIFPSKDKVITGSLGWSGYDLSRSIIVGLLTACGWDVVDLGGNVLPNKFADTCVEMHAIMLILAELPIFGRFSSVDCDEVNALIQALELRGIRQQTRILLVGCKSNERHCQQSAVDATCNELTEVPPAVRRLVTDHLN
jgi:5-methyltetrahydrofolate--homocysteine methyltransferase